jgi:ParB-like chromosome segregation protein Spo0J
MRETLFVENVMVPAHRARGLDDAAVERLMDSMRRLGLQTPISVRMDGDDLLLVAGRHRLEAARRLGWDRIEAVYIEGDENDARLWEISENLHRAELTAVERAEHIDEWRMLTEAKVGASCTHPGGRQPAERGIAKAARALGVSEDTVKRSGKIAALPKDVRDQARAEEWTQDRLLRQARGASPVPIAPDPLKAEQAIGAQVTRLMGAWDAAGQDARDGFLRRALGAERSAPAEDVGKVVEWLAARLDAAEARDLGGMLAGLCAPLSRALLQKGP